MPTYRNRTLVALVAGALFASLATACTSAGGEGGEGPTINHIQITAEQAPGVAVTIEAQVTDTDGIESVAVFYQAPHAGAWNSVALVLDSVRTGMYQGEIPGTAVIAPSVSYYVEAKDRKGVTTRLPADAPTTSFSFNVTGGNGADVVGPIISHVKVADNRPMGSEVTATATVTDATGVGSVVVKYRAQGATDWISMSMAAGANDKYTAKFPIAVIIPDAVEYYLEAVDTTPAAYRSALPTNAPDTFFTFTVSPGDETAPIITHTKIDDGQPEGRPVAVIARIEDLTGVASVTLFYRTHGASAWEQAAMTQASGTSYTAIIPAAIATTAGVDYYIEAVDTAPLANTARAPDTAPDVPYFFTTAPETCVVPPLNAESFEAGIFPGWWRTYALGLEGGWIVDDSEGHDGTSSAFHESYADDADSLLVMPCLDLTGLESEGLVIDFWQSQSSTSGSDVHTLEYALTNADPSSSTYTVVGAALPDESSSYTWGYRKVTIAPGAPMLGQTKVYFAFRYAGDLASAWFLDEIRVRRPGPAIELSSVTTTPNPVAAGNDVSLTVTLRNAGDGASAALTGTLTTTDTGLTITTPSSTFPGVAAGGETTSATAFHVAVAAGHADGDAPLKLTVTDGTRTYDLDVKLYVGVRATAHIVMKTGGLTYESDTELYLGVGVDPANPEWVGDKFSLSASSAGTFTYDVDLTAQAARLPPTLLHPWFLKAVHKWSGTLEIQQFTISYGATSFSALGLPWHAAVGSSSNPVTSYLMLPEPPRFSVDALVTTPAQLAPGTTGATLAVTVRNLGTATQGALTGALTLKPPTTAADVTGLTPTTPLSFASGPVGTNATATGASTWTFNVTAAHNDGSPLHFNLRLADAGSGLTWDLPVDVAVPWPGVSVLSWSTSGETSNSNYLPDPGETADLILVVKNTGTGATAGQVSGVLSVNPASSGLATVTAGMNSSTFGSGPLTEGATATSATTFRVVISGSAHAHQTITFDLTLTDGTNTWVKPVVVPLYAQFGATDPSGDASGNAVDLKYGFVNCDNTTMLIRITSLNAFDSATADVSVIIGDPPSGVGHGVKLKLSDGDLSAYTKNGTSWDAAALPASLAVSPESGQTAALVFSISLADLTTLGLDLSSKQARLGAQVDPYSSIYDALPDAWENNQALSDLASVSWP